MQCLCVVIFLWQNGKIKGKNILTLASSLLLPTTVIWKYGQPTYL